MLKKVFSLILFLSLAVAARAQMTSSIDENEAVSRKPVSFTHQPFLLIKLTPTSFLEPDRMLRYGVEIAPPFGKFSFCFDYGKGKGLGLGRKHENYTLLNKETKEYKGELRMYFSDWFPFYALDKKPFGRYYSIEYIQREVNGSQFPSLVDSTYAFTLPSTLIAGETLQSQTKERIINFKIGKHWHISRFFFIDTYAGLGLGESKTTPIIEGFDPSTGFSKTNFSAKFPKRELGDKTYFLNKTAGIRLCLVL